MNCENLKIEFTSNVMRSLNTLRQLFTTIATNLAIQSTKLLVSIRVQTRQLCSRKCPTQCLFQLAD